MPAFRRLIGLPVYYEYELYDNTQHFDVKLLQVWVSFLCLTLQLTVDYTESDTIALYGFRIVR